MSELTFRPGAYLWDVVLADGTVLLKGVNLTDPNTVAKILAAVTA